MKAITQLKVQPEMEVDVHLTMTVREMETLLEQTKDNAHRWPTNELRMVLRQSIEAASRAYHSEHVLPAS